MEPLLRPTPLGFGQESPRANGENTQKGFKRGDSCCRCGCSALRCPRPRTRRNSRAGNLHDCALADHGRGHRGLSPHLVQLARFCDRDGHHRRRSPQTRRDPSPAPAGGRATSSTRCGDLALHVAHMRTQARRRAFPMSFHRRRKHQYLLAMRFFNGAHSVQSGLRLPWVQMRLPPHSLHCFLFASHILCWILRTTCTWPACRADTSCTRGRL